MERVEENNYFVRILKGVGTSIVFTIISLSIFSCLLVFTDLSENYIQPVVIGVTGISVLMGSFFANRKMKKRGIVNGIIIGTLYIILLYLISSIINEGNFSLSIGAIIMMAIGVLGGAIGGIMGVNC